MTSLVTDLLVNPVLRQARRFSLSRSSPPAHPPDLDPLPRIERTRRHSQQDEVISETEETSSLRDEPGENTPSEPSRPSRPASWSSVLGNPRMDADDGMGEHHSGMYNTIMPTASASPAPDAPVAGLENDPSAALDPSTSAADPPSSPFLPDHSPLPEDDGMGSLRKRILDIQAQEIGHSEKAHMMHQLLMEGYTNSQARTQPEQPFSPRAPISPEKRASQGHGPLESFKFWQIALGEAESAENFILTDKDLEPTYVPEKQTTDPGADIVDAEYDDWKPLGCEHYRRNVKLQCSTCNRWYTCRFCHDEREDHTLIRKETRNMLCMVCGTAQRAGQTCVSCETLAARYYCDICKLWNDDPDKPCYHCNDCGICRIGHGIGKDFYHCKKCCACIAISTQFDHKCIERAIDCDCPICGEYMFTSPKPVRFMRCGHSIHRDCLDQHQKTSYKCPICNKSLLNMESQFRNLDLSIQAQPMPSEFKDARAIVLCHDCSAKSSTMYHWLGLKCGVCQSYNTAQLQIIGLNAEAMETDLVGRGAQASNLAAPGNPDAPMIEAATMRDTRRRHSSTVTRSVLVSADHSSFSHDRLARSVSPIRIPGRSLHASAVGGYFDLQEEEDGDIFSFWSRIPRSIGSNNEEGDDDGGESSDGMTSDGEVEDDEGEESEDDDFELLGHR
ncbi:putative CHY zinc finger [Rosellinia necatrix]|uniref:Putative CHY zinc finger n=1 Tax=Rosellinia necatrix TaxID=77044 RepID=A0A1W2TL19_ROSNE|nr:putative CHY zinc finger [Rosellinia necatrix]